MEDIKLTTILRPKNIDTYFEPYLIGTEIDNIEIDEIKCYLKVDWELDYTVKYDCGSIENIMGVVKGLTLDINVDWTDELDLSQSKSITINQDEFKTIGNIKVDKLNSICPNSAEIDFKQMTIKFN